MPYTLPSWADFPSTATPVDAANLTLLNDAIDDLDDRVTGLTSAVYSFPPWSMDPTGRAMNAANEAVYWRVWGAGTISSVRFRVATQSGNVAVAFYSNTVVSGVNQPNSRVATTGSVACPATGASSTVSLGGSVAIDPGMWVCFVADNTTATFVTNNVFPLGSEMLGDGVCYTQSSALPPPSSTSSLTAALRRIPLIRGVA